jgi:hypothetical protein
MMIVEPLGAPQARVVTLRSPLQEVEDEIPLLQIAKGCDKPDACSVAPRAYSNASQSRTASAFQRNAISNRERISKQWEILESWPPTAKLDG